MPKIFMPLGMTEEQVRTQWPGALDSRPAGFDRLSVGSEDELRARGGGLMVTWYEDERRWSEPAYVRVRKR